MNKKIFLLFLKRSFMKRLPKTSSCIVVLALSTALVFYALNVHQYGAMDVERTLRQMGPNVLVFPKEDRSEKSGGMRFLDESRMRAVMSELHSHGASLSVPFLYHAGKVSGKAVVAAGVELGKLKRIYPYMQLQYREENAGTTSAPDAAWVGARAAKILGIKRHQPFLLSFVRDGKKISMRLNTQVIFSTGESEDDRIFVSLQSLQETLHLEGKISLVTATLPAGSSFEIIPQTIEKKLAYTVQVKLAYALAKTQASFVQSVSSFLWVVAWILLVLSGCNVTAIFMAIFYERMQEMALLKTLGAGRAHLFLFFFAESLLIGSLGGIFGVFLGAVTLNIVFRQIFGAALFSAGGQSWTPFLISFLCALLSTTAATFLPLLKVLKVSPTVVLKGE